MFITVNCVAPEPSHHATLNKFLLNADCFKNKAKTFAIANFKSTEEEDCWYIIKTDFMGFPGGASG